MHNTPHRSSSIVAAALIVSGASAQSLVHYVPAPGPQVDYSESSGGVGDIDLDGVGDFATTTFDSVTFERHVRLISGSDASLIRELSAAVSGSSIAGCGDVDRDGTPDIVTGEPGFAGTGKATVVSGATGSAIWTFFGESNTDGFGIAVAEAGDANADGHPDILVGAWQYNPPFGNGPGYAKLYSGIDGSEIRKWSGMNLNTAGFGFRVTGAGDVDGDGHDDQLVADRSLNGGTVYVYSGADGSTLQELAPFGGNSQFGTSVAGGRDLDGDGVPDVLVGAYTWGPSASEGRISAWSGADWSQILDVQGQTPGAFFGGTVEVLDDVDGDGRPDVAASARLDAAWPAAVGIVTVFSSADGSVLSTITSESDGLSLATPAGPLALGDVDGDGLPELVVRAGSAVRVHSSTTLPPVSYCPAKPNSQGCVPTIGWSGTPGATGPDDFVLDCADMINNVRGAVVWSTEPNTMPFMGGTLCVGTPWTVAAPFFSAGTPGGVDDCSGATSLALTQSFLSSIGIGPGEPMFVQVLYRDPAQLDGTGWGLSDGVHFNVLP